MKMQKLIVLDDFSCVENICGIEDSNLKLLEKELKVSLTINPQGFLIKGSKTAVTSAYELFEKIVNLSKEGIVFTEQELKQYLDSQNFKKEPDNLKKDLPKSALSQPKYQSFPGVKVFSARKKAVFPKTKGQQQYLDAMSKYDIVFSTGPAGTGKTYLVMAMAINSLIEKKVRRIILTRPALEAGESLGFLPGDMYDKIGPYLRPLYDALYDMMEAETIENYLETGIIEIVPLAYMRGRTFNDAFVILDEAQNCTREQLKMFLTRLGFDSKTVITGDITQSDLPEGKPVGLLEAIEILKDIKGIKFINLGKEDVVRHPLTQEIIQAYEDFDQRNSS
ncbi:MAG: PhoH family protein [Candidatus Omnitrophota bacterium]